MKIQLYYILDLDLDPSEWKRKSVEEIQKTDIGFIGVRCRLYRKQMKVQVTVSH